VLGAVIAGIIITGDRTWYSALTKPFFAAPTWLSSGIWLFLYLLMGIALYLVYLEKGSKNMNLIFVAFGLAAIIPVLRAFFFWQLHYIVSSTALAGLLWLLTIGITLSFWHVSKKAGLLMVPVLLWVMFSLIVALAILALNGIILTL
jgi:tryptophan-rich sensory protein